MTFLSRRTTPDTPGPSRDQAPGSFAPAGDERDLRLHRVVIVGGGAGGLELAARLGDRAARERIEVVLIDEDLTHVWKPLLHEIAAGTLDAGSQTEISFLQQARRHGFRFHLGRMDGLDRARRHLWLGALVDDEGREIAPRRPMPYDTLVIAVGSEVNDFGTPGVREHAMRLDSAHDARRFHRRLLAACAQAEIQERGPVDIVIVGGGATGVELAAELVDAVAEIASYGEHLRRFERPVRVHLVEAGPRLLAALPEDLARSAHRDLEHRGVSVRVGERVTQVQADRVVLASGAHLPSAITVWAAGIRAPEVLTRLDGLETNKQRQLVVTPTLQTTTDPQVFAMGDCASCMLPGQDAPVPPRAQAAQQEADWLARALVDHVHGRAIRPFEYRDRGALVSLGTRDAIGRVDPGTGRRVTLAGLQARWAYWLVQRKHLLALHGLFRTVMATLGSWLAGRSQPRVKLH